MNQEQKRFRFSKLTFDWCMDHVEEFSIMLSPCTSSEGSSIRYNVTADALEWDDEFPNPEVAHPANFRQWYAAVLNARTTVVLGLDELGYGLALLGAVRETAPLWPGCKTERSIPELATVFAKLQSESMSQLSKMIDRI